MDEFSVAQILLQKSDAPVARLFPTVTKDTKPSPKSRNNGVFELAFSHIWSDIMWRARTLELQFLLSTHVLIISSLKEAD